MLPICNPYRYFVQHNQPGLYLHSPGSCQVCWCIDFGLCWGYDPEEVYPKLSQLGFPFGLLRVQVNMVTEVHVSVETITEEYPNPDVAYWMGREQAYLEAIPARLELLDQIMKLRRDSDSE